ncbi:hypothetical protein [Poriferisphaera sp. WC338]|uniref:hypothetical protein n=1 Tax=Poriferisphaera sp. WC338 TaxID=3425129 RepID=UPI003D8134A6
MNSRYGLVIILATTFLVIAGIAYQYVGESLYPGRKFRRPLANIPLKININYLSAGKDVKLDFDTAKPIDDLKQLRADFIKNAKPDPNASNDEPVKHMVVHLKIEKPKQTRKQKNSKRALYNDVFDDFEEKDIRLALYQTSAGYEWTIEDPDFEFYPSTTAHKTVKEAFDPFLDQYIMYYDMKKRHNLDKDDYLHVEVDELTKWIKEEVDKP